MREIKFRAWDTSAKKMFPNAQNHVLPSLSFGKMLQDTERFKMMQYTGLKDKNRREIYEGDILKRSTENRPHFLAVIEFMNGSFGGATIPYRNHWIQASKLSTCDHGGTGYDEIIGNIYENPELIERISMPNDSLFI